MAKTYVLDTSALINYPDIISTIKGHNVVIPGAVIRQLDYLKNSNDESVAWCSRRASQSIEKYQRKNRVTIMSNMGNGLVDMLHSGADNQIVATGRYLKNQGRNVCLLSTDRNMRIAARKYGMAAETGDDREIKVRIWKFITCVVFSVPMLSIIVMGLWKNEIIEIGSKNRGNLGISIALGFVITAISALMAEYYANRSRPRYSRDDFDDDDNVMTSAQYSYLEGNYYHKNDR
ncbi:MAG: PIN domain-containing protein [Proteobacteria bacterium]|nr:PIN domain-containing protein [Pseudomonadota bacterium]